MNLWIRSQDRYQLIKINTINLNYTQKNQIIANYRPLNDGEYYEVLGTYKNEERALEILDKIGDLFFINKKNLSIEEADLFLKANMLPKYYVMPKE